MKIIDKKKVFESNHIPEDYIFIDIECTGLAKEKTDLYLVGVCSYKDESLIFRQWFLESPSEEAAVLSDVAKYLEDYKTLVTFNGNFFDLPYLDYHAKKAGVPSPYLSMNSLDLYLSFKCLKRLFSMERTRQKDFEVFIGDNREDTYGGGELINVYYDYLSSRDDELLHLLLLHNEEDVLEMPRLMPILAYTKLNKKDVDIIKAAPEIVSKTDDEILLQFDACDYFFRHVSKSLGELAGGIYVSLCEDKINLKLPLYTGELKYFFPHARDYFYLPKEDIAVHKSVGCFVDPAFREKATKENCYTKKEGTFFPLVSLDAEEIYRKCYGSCPYATLTDEILDDADFWSSYLHSLFELIRKPSKSTDNAFKNFK